MAFRKQRLAYFVDSMQVGGTELNAIRTLENLDRTRFDIRVLHLGLQGPLAERYAVLGVPRFHIAVSSLLSPGVIPAVFRAARVLREGRVELLHAHDVYSNLLGLLAGRLAGVPVIVTSRRWLESVPRPRLAAANRWAFRASTRVLANSEAVREALEARDGVREERIHVVPNFVEDAAFEPYPETQRDELFARLGIPAGSPVIGIVARLAPVKDHATLLRAFASLPGGGGEPQLLIVGEGESRAALEAQARELGIGARAHFAGFLPSLPNPHALFDLSVLSSVSEGFPNSVVEAMAAGRPVVATRVGGTPEAVREQETGLLVPPGDPAALAAAIAQLLQDPGRRQRMGEAARRLAAERYGVRAVIEGLSDWYASLRG